MTKKKHKIQWRPQVPTFWEFVFSYRMVYLILWSGLVYCVFELYGICQQHNKEYQAVLERHEQLEKEYNDYLKKRNQRIEQLYKRIKKNCE